MTYTTVGLLEIHMISPRSPEVLLVGLPQWSLQDCALSPLVLMGEVNYIISKYFPPNKSMQRMLCLLVHFQLFNLARFMKLRVFHVFDDPFFIFYFYIKQNHQSGMTISH